MNNLLDTISGLATPDLVGGLANRLGESESGIGKALAGALPLVLGGLISKAGSSEGAQSVFGLAQSAFEQSGGGLGSAAGLLGLAGGADASGTDTGSSLLGSVFGSGAEGLAGPLSSFAGISPTAASSVLGLAGTAVPALLGQHASANNLDSGGLETLLAGLKDQVSGMLPDGLGSLAGMLGLGGLGAVASRLTGSFGDATANAGAALDGASAALDGAVGSAGAALGNVAGGLGSAADNLDNAASSAGAALGSAGAALGNAAGGLGNATGGLGNAGTALGNAGNALGNAAGDLGNAAGNLGRAALPAPAGGSTRWPFVLLLLAAGALLYYFFVRKNDKPADAAPTATSTTAPADSLAAGPDAMADSAHAMGGGAATAAATAGLDSASAAAKAGWAKLGAMTALKLADGSSLNAPANGVEGKLVAFLDDASKPVDKTTWFSLDRLLFKTGSAELLPASQEQLDNVAAILKAYPAVKLKLGGYTDSRGNAALNKKLSGQRAAAVQAKLGAAGTAADRLASEGYGAEHPLASNDTPEGRQQNRRVDACVTAK